MQTKSADGTWQGFRQGKWRTMLAVLLVRSNHVVPSDELVRQLWPEEAPGSQRKLVQQYVHRLRRSLNDPDGEVLRTRPAGYELRVSPGELDVDRFDALCADGRRALATAGYEEAVAHFGQAMALWRGTAMADAGNAPAVVVERIRMTERRLAAMELWLRAGLACGRHDLLIPELECLVVAHPLRERFRELLMTALYQTGRRADALSVARHLRCLLREDLGIDPGAGIQRLERTILLGEGVDLSLLCSLAVPIDS